MGEESLIKDISLEGIINQYSLYGDFYISTSFTQGDWQITFPIE